MFPSLSESSTVRIMVKLLPDTEGPVCMQFAGSYLNGGFGCGTVVPDFWCNVLWFAFSIYSVWSVYHLLTLKSCAATPFNLNRYFGYMIIRIYSLRMALQVTTTTTLWSKHTLHNPGMVELSIYLLVVRRFSTTCDYVAWANISATISPLEII